MKENLAWNFPSNNSGEISGIGEAGIEMFRGNPFSSLCREICQNSLDARMNGHEPVYVEFKLSDVPRGQILGVDELERIMGLCKRFWADDTKAINFFEKAESVARQDCIRVLRISDFNTTGLTGSMSERASAWMDLVKSSGVSNKSSSAGGSYGIGKSAPFVCSDLRTLFYSTLDKDGIKASQGVARLVSFERENEDGTVELTQKNGYYGKIDRNLPWPEVLNFTGYQRSQTGTDIYVLGFSEDESWKDEIIKAVLDGYLISVIKEELVVLVDDVTISADSLAMLMERYKSEISAAYNYYVVMTSEETEENRISLRGFPGLEDLEGVWDVHLKVLIRNDLHRKILMSRNTGMKLFDQDRISGSIRFAGVCVLEGDEINQFFREMENPEHTKWEPDRHREKEKAKRVYQALKRIIKDTVLELGRNTTSDSTDAIGAGTLLPDQGESLDSNGGTKESINDRVREYTDIEAAAISTSTSGKQSVEAMDIEGEVEVEGNLLEGAEEEGVFNYHTNQHTRSNEGQDDNCTGVMSDDGDITLKQTVSVKPLNLRIMRNGLEQNIYKVQFQIEESLELVYMEVLASGEVGNASMEFNNGLSETKEPLNYSGGKLYLGDLLKDKQYVFFFGLKYSEMCSMEVKLYGRKV